MSMVSELLERQEAAYNAEFLLRVLREALLTDNPDIKDFVGRMVYNRYLSECCTAKDKPNEDIVKAFGHYDFTKIVIK